MGYVVQKISTAVQKAVRFRSYWFWVGFLSLGMVLASAVCASNDRMLLRERVEGRGAILHSDQAAARQRALRASLRRAVERAMAKVLASPLIVANIKVVEKELYRKSKRYIRSYRVLWEYPDLDQQVYRIGIEADVAVGELSQAVEQLGLTASGSPALRLLVLMSEGPRTDARFVGQITRMMMRALRSKLEAKRFRVVEPSVAGPWDGEEASALEVGRAADAHIVLVGWVSARKTHDGVAGMVMQTVEAESQLRAWVPETGLQLVYERTRAVVDHADTFLAGRQALEQAAEELAARVLPALHRYRQQETARSTALHRRF